VHIHILGICGTFMGSMALLARELGFKVTGSDANVYPPMSTQLETQGISLMQGYKAEHLQPAPDLVIVGNALSRGNEAVEYMLEQGLRYTSGAQWLKENVLEGRWVLAVSGTHGKTTTASMLAWILEYAKMEPGYLIGGIPADFEVSARLGKTPFFVIEADEYDTAFFDKRSKFVHYQPRTVVINNLEYDHADIFADLAAIQRQFHHLLRIVPSNGQVIYNGDQASVQQVLEQGCWSEKVSAGGSLIALGTKEAQDDHWAYKLLRDDGSSFELYLNAKKVALIDWSLTGTHNVCNAMMAMIAARHVGVEPQHSAVALMAFQGVKRRMELLAEIKGIKIYDDFAHHPTAIKMTLEGLRKNAPNDIIIAVIEPRSNTMRLGSHAQQLAGSISDASNTVWYQPEGLDWQLEDSLLVTLPASKVCVKTQIKEVIDVVVTQLENDVGPSLKTTDNNTKAHVVIMSNGGFGGIHQQLISRLESVFNDD
jgi:UDP-N-acetylmuramate: L-alanyl-gamma-D-glutamyl-meso-diaminopimelate ligase